MVRPVHEHLALRDVASPSPAHGDAASPSPAHGKVPSPSSAHGDAASSRPANGDPASPNPAHGDVASPTLTRGRVAHGGDLSDGAALAEPGGIRLDLSTGINPHAYPAALEHGLLRALPQKAAEADLIAAARDAYRVPDRAAIVAAPGTQALIQWLPHLIPARSVAVVGPTYAEHAAAWSTSAQVEAAGDAILADPGGAELVVVVNPNNPDGRHLTPTDLARAAEMRAAGAGRHLAAADHPVLVVDEAFMDLSPEDTVAGAPHTLVLRSFGKFYGLGGLRLGFAVGAPPMVARIAAALGPWAVSAPALAIGRAALGDKAWAFSMRARLAAERAALDDTLAAHGLRVTGGTDLFRLVADPQAQRWHRALAAEGVWTRIFDHAPNLIRFGLPGDDAPILNAALVAAADRVHADPPE